MKKFIKRPVGRPKRKKVVTPSLVQPPVTLADLQNLFHAVLSRPAFSPAPAPRFTRIEHHTDENLEAAINTAARDIPDFYKILHGVDAYMERRRRKLSRALGEPWKQFDGDRR